MSVSNFGLRCLRGILRNPVSVQGIRTLYSASSLGIDAYTSSREKVSMQFENIGDTFRSKMTQYTSPESNSLIFTEDLKHMLHLVDGSESDMSLVEEMILKFAKQNREVRFGSFIFGPVVMRMYYHLNKPQEALKMFMHPDTDGFFDQMVSFQILMDLLFNSGMYDDIIKVFDKVSTKQLLGTKYPKNCVVLVLAACYKINTESSFDYMKKLWNDLMVVGHTPMRRATTFAAALALNQNQPAICLEILASLKFPNYVTTRNLKVLALASLGRPGDCFPILRAVLEVDSNRDSKNTFFEEVVAKVGEAAQKAGNKDIINEFERIEKQLRSNGHLINADLDTVLCQEITAVNRFENVNEGYGRYGQQLRSQRGTNRYTRPGLRDLM